MHSLNPEKICHRALTAIEMQASAVQALQANINSNFVKACEYMLSCKGRVIVLGMGKSGHIGRKIAATLASTGTPAFFIHPAEASHGDLGMIIQNDVVLMLSNSGETEEILTILPAIKRLQLPIIAMTANSNSTLAKSASIHFAIHAEEACPLGVAPTSSTTAMMVMGDALAAALMDARNFTREDFARSHPKGLLGKRLLLQIKELMHVGDAIPKVDDQATISQALVEMTRKGLGLTTITNNQNYLLGIYTDGDLRRTIDKGCDIHTTNICQVMTPRSHLKTIQSNMLAFDALQMMETFKITSLLVIDEHQALEGILHIHDLFRAGVK